MTKVPGKALARLVELATRDIAVGGTPIAILTVK